MTSTNQGPKKLLIVGEPGTGKSALIKAFLTYQQKSSQDLKFDKCPQ